MPLISVIMGIYNEKNRQDVQDAIQSILNQTFSDFEFIICDDGSEGEFYQWLKEYCRIDDRIKLYRNDRNRGLSYTLNHCLQYAEGQFIARMDADDRSLPDRFEKQILFLQENPQYAVVGCNVQRFGRDGVWGQHFLEEYPDKKTFLKTSAFVHPSVMFRKDALIEAGGYTVSDRVLRVEDYDLFMRLYIKGYKGYNIQETLFQYREEPSSYSKKKYKDRWNEFYVRYQRFGELGIRKGNMRYVLKPLIAGVVPAGIMRKIHGKRYQKS